MNRQTMMAAAIAAAMMTITVSLFAAEQPTAPARKSEPIYGYRMMSDQERNEYRERMRNAASADDHRKIRDDHCMASHGRTGLSRLLLGSQTAKVLALSKVPVMVIR